MRFAATVLLFCVALSLVGCAGLPGTASVATPQGYQRKASSPSTTLLYVSNHTNNSVSAFPLNANGNVSPVGTISGKKTRLNQQYGVGLDASGNVYVVDPASKPSVFVYPANTWGDVRPIREIKGEKTKMTGPYKVILDSSGNTYVSNNSSKHSGSGSRGDILAFAPGSNGNVSPEWSIAGLRTELTDADGMAWDSSGNLYVANSVVGSCGNDGNLFVFAAGALGNVAPITNIGGSQTQLCDPTGIAADSTGNIYASNWFTNTVTVYAAGSNGNIAPIRVISGSNTGLDGPAAIAVDASNNIYVANALGNSITVYSAGSNGNVSPVQTISGSNTGLSWPVSLAIYPAP